MQKAFLSHSSSNKDLVGKIARAMGNNCNYDDMSFESGMPILSEIMQCMDHSDLFVLFISDNALKSQWVKREITNAKKLSNDDLMRIYPVIIDPKISVSDSRIPSWLRRNIHIKTITRHPAT